MWQFRQHIASRRDPLALGHEYATVNRQLYFGEAGEAQIGTTLPLTYPLAVAKEGTRRKPESMPVELQDDVIVLIGTYPKPGGLGWHLFVGLIAVKIHNLALDRTARRIRAETVHANDDLVCLAVQHALVREPDVDDGAVDGTDDAERCRGNISLRITEYQGEIGEQDDER